MASDRDLALVATGVHIEYRSRAERRTSGVRDRVTGSKRYGRELRIHAVRGVSFNLLKGETLGLVGHNGCGKSSLLQGLAGLHPLAKGTVYATARPTLLGIKAALNVDVSGRRNLILGCLAQGLSLAETNRQLPELIEFTGLGKFIDLPMSAYSTGMKTRITFTVATVRTPKILFIDEAMAGGDREFRSRARGRLKEIQAASGAVVVVSHNLGQIEALCDRAMWMEHGRIIERGGAKKVLRAYKRAPATTVGTASRDTQAG